MIVRYKWVPAKSFTQGRTKPLGCLVVHATDGHEAGDVETLTQGKVSVHWYVTRRGSIYHFVSDCDTAYHVGRADQPAHTNAATLGIELEHIDGQENWPLVQLETLSELVAALRQKHGNLPMVPHALVARPKGRKIDPWLLPYDILHRFFVEAAKEHWTFKEVS